MPQSLATSSGTAVVSGTAFEEAAIGVAGSGIEGAAGAPPWPVGVEGKVPPAVRLRFVGDRCGPSRGAVAALVCVRGNGLLVSDALSAVGGRARFVGVVGGGSVALLRSRAVAARVALSAAPAAVGIMAAARDFNG